MAMFKYVGDVETVTCFGVEFKQGEPAEVTDETAIAKLTANEMFEKIDGRSKEAKKAKGDGDPE